MNEKSAKPLSERRKPEKLWYYPEYKNFYVILVSGFAGYIRAQEVSKWIIKV